jgi:hypothetical protein
VGIDVLGLGRSPGDTREGDRGPIEVRVVKFRLCGGEKKTLITSLTEKRYSFVRFVTDSRSGFILPKPGENDKKMYYGF